MSSPIPEFVASFYTTHEILGATLDVLSVVVDGALPAPGAKPSATKPLYGIGPNFIVDRRGERLTEEDVQRRISLHLATATSSESSPALRSAAQLAASVLVDVRNQVFTTEQESAA